MRLVLPLLLVSCAAPTVHDAVSSPTKTTLWPEEKDGVIEVKYGDETFAGVHFSADPKPFLYPLHAPGDIPVTRGWPYEEREGEAKDHPHHTSVWFAHGNVNGVDFWHPQAKNGGTIEFTGKLKELLKRGKRMRLRHEYEWKGPDDEAILHERRTTLLGVDEGQRWVDFTFELTALADEVTFGDTKEGTMAVRVHPALRHEGDLATGSIRNSEGHEDKRAWGKRAKWVHYYGTVEEQEVGLALFEHPDNFRHPTWWHARTYGLLAANPFGKSDFERAEKGAGNHVLAKDETLTLRYRLWIHSGTKSAEEVAEAYEVYRVQSKSE